MKNLYKDTIYLLQSIHYMSPGVLKCFREIDSGKWLHDFLNQFNLLLGRRIENIFPVLSESDHSYWFRAKITSTNSNSVKSIYQIEQI